MRLILICLIALPVFGKAQVNRSATELARENIGNYLQGKLFREQPYKPVSYGKLKYHNFDGSEVMWSLEHRFEIIAFQEENNKKVETHKPYKFVFFMDRRMEVIKASGSFTE